MTAKKFCAVFEKISLPSLLTEVFAESTVHQLTINKNEKSINILIESDEIISEQYIDALRTELINQIPVVKTVNIHLKYSTADNGNRIWENIVYSVSKISPICKNIINDAVPEEKDGVFVVRVKNNMAYYMSKKGIDKFISEKLFEENGITTKVMFKNEVSEEAKEELREINARKEREFIINNIVTTTDSEAIVEETLQAADDENKDIIIGKRIKGEPMPIINALKEGEKAIIEGNMFNFDTRELKGGKVLVTFDIADKTDAVTVKVFADTPAFKKIKENLKNGKYIRVGGIVKFDEYSKEINMMARDITLAEAPPIRMDNAEEKRVELHLHTQMSSMDGVTPAKEYVKRAIKWGHKAIAITDHGVVQSFPEAMHEAEGKIKVIYGMEAYLVDDLGTTVLCSKGQTIDDEFTVFDIETTGLSKERDKITEIGAVKVKNGKIEGSFSTFVNPQMPLSEEITKLTGITDDMLKDAPLIDTALVDFLEFAGDSVLVAHNAGFDTGFIRKAAENLGLHDVENTILDTLELARSLLPELKKHKLNIVAEAVGVDLKGHHRAVNDAKATAEIFVKFIEMLAEKEVFTMEDINIFSSRTINYKKLKPYHAIIIAKNLTGLRNLYELVSISHIDYFFKRPRIPKSLLMKYRDGLILGSACEAGELYRAILDGKPKEVINNIVSFYDYLEIQPNGNNAFLVREKTLSSERDIEEINKKIVALGDEHGKLTVATCDTHFIDPDDAAYRKIIMAAEGFKDADNQAPLYFRTTEEMLKEFEYLGEEKAYEVVVKNTNAIADMVDVFNPVPAEKYPPVIEGSEEKIREIAYTKAHSIYGNPLPEIIQTRLDKELDSIIKNGFSVMYIIAQKLVWKSNEDGYLVGSRGSVGSSFAATMLGITEVNPLPAHYVCPNCKYSDFESEEVKKAQMETGSGCDMPDKMCPNCGTKLYKDGHDIPFETFLGFDGDKEPDIDLNFSGEYQQRAHAYTEELFGTGHVYKAGTIGTLADKTAYGFVKRYADDHNMTMRNSQINNLVRGCTGIKRTTGQHPGGLIIVPEGHTIYEFCPVQRPANDTTSNVTTTHFDYHSIDQNLLKLDLLGHDDPTVIRMLYDITGVNPQTVPLDDKATMSLFTSPDALGVTEEQIHCKTGTLGIPEFGTKFVRGMLLDTNPQTFADLLRISGLSHGTDVWINNAQELIANGTITLKDTISTRDSIMGYLINKGLENKKSFKIMEQVRKGKGLKDEDIELMKSYDVPDWYIKSCQKIKYMFPKAHAAAYVMMAFRIAYFKVNYPEAYYASYFTVRACDDFDYTAMCSGEDAAKRALAEIEAKGTLKTAKDKNKITVLEIIIEFYERGLDFLPIDLYESDATKFIVKGSKLLPPFSSIQGLGANAANSIVEARKDGEFHTLEELKARTQIGKTLLEVFKELGILDGIPETDQLTLF